MKLSLPLFFLFFLTINLYSQRQLIDVNKSIDELEEEYDLSNPSFFSKQNDDIPIVDNSLDELNKKLSKFASSRNNNDKYLYSIRYVRGRIMKYYLQSQRLLKYNELEWERREERSNIASFQQTVDGSRVCYFASSDKESFRKETKTINKLVTDEFNASFDSLWKNNLELGYQIRKVDSIVYISTTKDSTLRQFEYFLSRFIYNSFTYNAFEAFYNVYTSDGEKTTFKGFEDYCTEHYPFHLEKLKKTYSYKRDKKYSEFIYNVFKLDDDDIEIEHLEEIIDSTYPREPSFVALQRLIKYQLQSQEYCKAIDVLNKYSALFSSKVNAFNKVSIKFYKLQELIKNKGGEQDLPNISPFLNDDKDEVRMMANDDRDRFFVRGTGKGIATSYKKENEKWNKVQNYQGGASIFLYNKKQDLIKKFKTDFVRLEKINFSKELILDLNFTSHDGYDILFFTTKSDHDRKDNDFNSQDNDIDYKSYGHVDKSSIPSNNPSKTSLRDIEKKGTFHGMKYGNFNTDIYYVYKRKVDDNWSPPYNIGRFVNTPFSERTPVLVGSTLFFSSEGHTGFGGLDIFSVSLNINFTPPEEENAKKRYNATGPITTGTLINNLYKFNSTFDELSYTPMGTENESFFSSDRKNNNYDIYYHNGKINKSKTGTTFNLQAKKSTSSTSDITGTIKNACGIKKIKVYLNGNSLKSDSFIYSKSSGEISVKGMKLQDGQNEVKIKATDILGHTSSKTIIIDTQKGLKPEVIFTAPIEKEEDIFFNDDTLTIKAIVKNVYNKNGIVFKINNLKYDKFHFDVNKGEFYFTTDTNTFSKMDIFNKVELIGTNDFGSNMAQMELVSKKRAIKKYPGYKDRIEDIFSVVKEDTSKSSDISEGEFRLIGNIMSARDGSPLEVTMLFSPKDGERRKVESFSNGRYVIDLEPKEYNISIIGEDGGGMFAGNYYYDFRALKGRRKVCIREDLIVAASDTSNLLSEIFFFDTNKWNILNPNKLRDKFRDYLDDWSQTEYIITIYGYADYRGELTKNCHLSRDRASAIKNYLVEIGFDPSRIKILGVGEVALFDGLQVKYSLPYPRSYYVDQEAYDLQMNRRGQLMISFPNNQPSPSFLQKKKIELPTKDCLQTIRP